MVNSRIHFVTKLIKYAIKFEKLFYFSFKEQSFLVQGHVKYFIFKLLLELSMTSM